MGSSTFRSGTADTLAMEAVKRPDVEIKVPLSKGQSIIWREAVRKWQFYWEGETKGMQLYKVQKKVYEKK